MAALTQEALASAADAMGAPLPCGALERLARYRELTAAANARFNLTSPAALADIERVHFLDALSLVPRLPRGATSLVDVGSGGGFPGLVLAIALPALRVTLVEASAKRAVFLRETAAALGVAARVEHGRAETLARAPELREAFDAATARALGALPVVLELTLPFLRVGGVLLAQRGADGEREAREAANAALLLGGSVRSVESAGGGAPVELPQGERGKMVVVVDKTAPTPAAYPRGVGRPAKRPLR